jgi:glycosyltransferase involved in cell wall biosynthesis
MSLISIILPTYKSPLFLERAIRSVRAQSYKSWELIIVDDGLSEITQKKLEDLISEDSRIRILKNPTNLGIQKSLNRGVHASRGELIARIDDDDEWVDPLKLEKQLDFFIHNPKLVLLGTAAMIVDEKGAVLDTYRLPLTDRTIRNRMLFKNCFLHPTIIVRREALEKVGGYDEFESTRHIEDYDLWLKLGTLGEFSNLPEPTTILMIHPDSITSTQRLAQVKKMQTLIKKYKKVYPNFFPAQLVLFIRYIGFLFISLIPIPRRVLYLLQGLYKRI